MINPIVHSITRLSAGYEGEAHEIFRATCAVTDPHWTRCGPDPIAWRAPADAAGGLVLWDHCGEPTRAEPPADDMLDTASRVYRDLVLAGGVIGIVRASYASSGGRVVALCEYGSHWYITVSRCEPVPRRGATEEAIERADTACFRHLGVAA